MVRKSQVSLSQLHATWGLGGLPSVVGRRALQSGSWCHSIAWHLPLSPLQHSRLPEKRQALEDILKDRWSEHWSLASNKSTWSRGRGHQRAFCEGGGPSLLTQQRAFWTSSPLHKLISPDECRIVGANSVWLRLCDAGRGANTAQRVILVKDWDLLSRGSSSPQCLSTSFSPPL